MYENFSGKAAMFFIVYSDINVMSIRSTHSRLIHVLWCHSPMLPSLADQPEETEIPFKVSSPLKMLMIAFNLASPSFNLASP